MKHAYYHSLIGKTYAFLIPQNKTILAIGIRNGNILRELGALQVVCLAEAQETCSPEIENIEFIRGETQEYIPDRKFDYIILDKSLGKTNHISRHLKNILQGCHNHTRIIIHEENHLWEPLLKLASWLGLKKRDRVKNWLSVGDIHTFLKSSGFEPIRTFKRNIFPARAIVLGPILNWLCFLFPFLDFLFLDQFIVARPLFPVASGEKPSATICLTVRDEEKNIEPIVKSLPVLCSEQEILFVEGHSTDKTVDEIKRMQRLYPEKNIRLLHQNGKGQGDAIRKGFSEAMGDVIMLYEGDGTSDPEDLHYVYECMANGRYEFVEGSRFVYPLGEDVMPFINKVGNVFFAKWFSLFLKQRITDVLSGIKAISRKNFQLINETWGQIGIQDPFGDFELLYGAARYGLKIGEIPIHYKPRSYGKSKTRALLHGSYLLKMAWKGYWIFKQSKYKKNKTANESSAVHALGWQ